MKPYPARPPRPFVPPLQQLENGVPYKRFEHVEERIAQLSQLPPKELLARCGIRDKSDAGYVASECLLHFLRRTREDDFEGHFADLFELFAARVFGRMLSGKSSDGQRVSLSRQSIREEVMDNLVKWIVSDRTDYVKRLDFFEVRFDMALARLICSAERKVWRHENRTVEIEDESEPGEISREVETAIGSFDFLDNPENYSFEYRLALDAAIDQLPPLQQQIVEMLRHQIPIDSKVPGVVTISKTLGKVEKTIRNQRDKAFATIREKLDHLQQP